MDMSTSGVIPVNADEVKTNRVSRSIVEDFMESGAEIVEVKPDFYNKSQFNLRMMLAAFIRNNKLPLKVFEQDKKLYIRKIESAEPIPQPQLRQLGKA